MTQRRGRVWIAATILAVLFAPAAGSLAGPGEQLEKTQEALEEIRSRIDSLEARKGSLKDEIRALNASIVHLRNEVTKLNAQVVEIESKVRTVQARIDLLQSKIDRIKKVATQQAIDLYKSGATETIDALLNSKSLTELDDKVAMLGVAAQKNTGALIGYGTLRSVLAAQNQLLFQRKQELNDTLASRSEVLEGLEELYAKHAEKLYELEQELGEAHRHEGELESASNKLEAKILEQQTLHSVAVLGKSDQGFIWPLNGAITSYYGPRWGGMHSGLDIDGVAGQPVVASAAGRVMLASSYSGYGYAVIIDHGNGISTLYAHLSGFDVSAGQVVSQGEIVGRVGCTGSCTGDHLHFEVRVNGAPRNPLDYLP